MRLDNARRMEVLQRQHDAVVARTDAVMRASGGLLYPSATTAIVAHRQAWFTHKIGQLLTAQGIVLLGCTDIGAEAVGWAIAEQPSLVVVDDTLAMVSSQHVIREIRHYCPQTIIAAQVPHNDRAGAMFEAGADAVHTRAVPHDLAVEDMLRLLIAS